MARMVVTGAVGFIGSHLTERLLASGHQVIGVDSFAEHYPRHLKELNLRNFVDAPGFELVEADIAHDALVDLFEGTEVAFHLAARPGVRESWEDFDAYVESNVLGSRAVFHAAAASRTRVIYASSSSVYGNAAALPAAEAGALSPISPYGASKVMVEALAGAYSSSYGLDAVGLRYFSVFGPRQRPDMAMARFIAAVKQGRPIQVYGDGLQRRDMTYVGDVVDATLAAAEHGRSHAVYNIASGTPTALLTILRELAEILDSPLRLKHESRMAGDVRDTWGDATKAAEDLGFTPSVSLREGLEQQVAEDALRETVPAAT